LLLFLLACHVVKNNPHEEEWISLFNGADLSGWEPKIAGFEAGENYKHTFLVEDSILKINYQEYDSFHTEYGHLYYHQPFSYYKLRLEYRFVGKQVPGGAPWNVRNSGVMLHSQSAQEQGLHQHFPVSVEMQFLGGLGSGERPTANLCTPGTMVEMQGKLVRDHCINSRSKTFHGDQWVSVEAIVLGDSVLHHLVGTDTVLSYSHPQIDAIFVNAENYNWEQANVPHAQNWPKREGERLTSGHIALQAESHPIHFRHIRLLNLKGCMDPKARNYKSYYLKADPSACVY